MRELKQCTVLLVDDIRENIQILVEALKGAYKLGFALDGESALKYARAKAPDLILLDIMMPGMDGYEVCRRLKADPITRDIPVLFITAMDETECKAAGFEAGAVDYITKPFEIVEVKARVKTHLSLKLARETLLRQRDMMQQSLDLAMEVQQSLLPEADPVVRGLDIAGTSIYCDETGGDYYDYLDMGSGDQGRVRVVVGDVSDHGIPSALLMTTARAFLRQRSSMKGDIGEIVSDANTLLSRDVGDSGSYMTLFICEIDWPAKRMRWVRAGHDPAVFYDPAADAFEALRGAGMALGVDEGWRSQENEKHGLARGQIILLCTDGVWEARNPGGEMFGKEAVRETIRANASKTAKGVLNAIIQKLNRFQQGVESEDDVTLVVIKIK